MSMDLHRKRLGMTFLDLPLIMHLMLVKLVDLLILCKMLFATFNTISLTKQLHATISFIFF